jgi:hypothetical protein
VRSFVIPHNFAPRLVLSFVTLFNLQGARRSQRNIATLSRFSVLVKTFSFSTGIFAFPNHRDEACLE